MQFKREIDSKKVKENIKNTENKSEVDKESPVIKTFSSVEEIIKAHSNSMNIKQKTVQTNNSSNAHVNQSNNLIGLNS